MESDFSVYFTRRAHWTNAHPRPGETFVRDGRNTEAPYFGYKIPRGCRSEFRQWIRDMWDSPRVTGSYEAGYSVDMEDI